MELESQPLVICSQLVVVEGAGFFVDHGLISEGIPVHIGLSELET